jgi:hypothetical protein
MATAFAEAMSTLKLGPIGACPKKGGLFVFPEILRSA